MAAGKTTTSSTMDITAPAVAPVTAASAAVAAPAAAVAAAGSAMAAVASASKKPAGKAPSKVASAMKAPGKKRANKGKTSSSSPSYHLYICKVLKQVHSEIGITSKSLSIMQSMVDDIFERIVTEAKHLAVSTHRSTVGAREIQSAGRLVLPGELSRHAVSEGTKAVAKYTTTRN